MAEIENPHDDPEKAKTRKEQQDPWVMYLIVRESLGMGAGKIGAQCGHAVGMVYEKLEAHKKEMESLRNKLGGPDSKSHSEEFLALNLKVNHFYAWKNESYRKVVLRADDKEWEKVKAELPCFVVRDAGFTEVPAGSETVIGLWPMKKSQAPKIIKKLQVMK